MVAKMFNFTPSSVEKWHDAKWNLEDRLDTIHTTAEEEPEELAELEELAQAELQFLASLPEQPASLTAVSTSLSSSPVTSGDFSLDTNSDYATSISDSITDITSITWAPLPDAFKQPRKPSPSRRFRQKLGFLRRLVCFLS